MTKLKLFEILSLPFTYIALRYFKFIRRYDPSLLPKTTKFYQKVGIYPVKDHYYEPFPQIKYKSDQKRLDNLIDLNIDNQLKLLSEFNYHNEIENLWENGGELKVKYKNTNRNFSSGSIDILYSFIRHFKPSKIIEIGGGYSTIIAANALLENKKKDVACQYDHTCIEPYEMNWLKDLPINLIREQVQNVNIKLFESLKENDILFIDSSHMIKPEGDVLYEYLRILPILQKGVIIHIHDIFTPYNYPDNWIKENLILWNEQYLLESILIHSNNFKILNSLYYLHTNYFNQLSSACPTIKSYPDRKGSSLWLVKEKTHLIC